MRHHRAVSLIAAILATAWQAAPIARQPKPNFSGTWIVVSPERGKGAEMIVTHDEKTLVLERPSPKGPARRQTFILDGLEHKELLPVSGMQVTLVYRAVWEGNRLVITNKMDYSTGMKTQAKDIWSLDADGRLTMESSETGPRGSAGPVTKAVFARKR
jgi:hypothetical protein